MNERMISQGSVKNRASKRVKRVKAWSRRAPTGRLRCGGRAPVCRVVGVVAKMNSLITQIAPDDDDEETTTTILRSSYDPD